MNVYMYVTHATRDLTMPQISIAISSFTIIRGGAPGEDERDMSPAP